MKRILAHDLPWFGQAGLAQHLLSHSVGSPGGNSGVFQDYFFYLVANQFHGVQR